MSVLSELFGDCPQLKIIECFVENYQDNLYVADISRMTGVSKMTVMKHVKVLLEENIIVKARKAGQVQFYQLNVDNPKAKIILLLESYIVKEKLNEVYVQEKNTKTHKRL